MRWTAGYAGSKFTLYDLVDCKQGCAPENQKKISRIIEFLLHMRLSDYSKPYFEVSVVSQLQDSVDGWMFNERVMQILIESDYVKKLFGRGREHDY